MTREAILEKMKTGKIIVNYGYYHWGKPVNKFELCDEGKRGISLHTNTVKAMINKQIVWSGNDKLILSHAKNL